MTVGLRGGTHNRAPAVALLRDRRAAAGVSLVRHTPGIGVPQHEVFGRDDGVCGLLPGAPTGAIPDLETRHVEVLTLSGPEWSR